MSLKYAIVSFMLIYASIATSAKASNNELPIIPQPQSIKWLGHTYIVPEDTVPTITIASGIVDLPASRESYRLIINDKHIQISANDRQGALWAKRTLMQLRQPDGSYPQIQITDYPEFPIRGFLYDDGRNFAGVDRIKKYIDIMSSYKLNTFQWHLTDKPAWRIECKSFPRLNDGRFQRPGRDQGKFYTYDEIREIFEYADQRGIMIIPEIDMPGHSDYFQTTFGVPMDSERGKNILERCIAEFCEEIPADICPYIHIGSDEVHITDPDGFMSWAQKLVRSHGRNTMAWDPGLPADNFTIRQFWREGGLNGEKYPENVPFVDSAMGYLNNYDPLLATAKIYFHTICGTGRADKHRIGGIVCLWNDVRVEDKDLTAQHNGLASGIMAFSERAWYGGSTSTDDSMPYGTIIPPHTDRGMQQFENLQKRIAYHKQWFLEQELSYWTPIHAPEWNVEIHNDTINCEFKAYGDILDLDALCRVHNIPDNIPLSCQISRNIHSDIDTVKYFKIGFEAPARSNRNSDGIAQQGEWPNEGRISVNGINITPPIWNEPGAYRYHYNTWARLEEELPYTDEQLYWMRNPVAIQLKKGSNNIVISLKRHFNGQHFQASFIEVPEYQP